MRPFRSPFFSVLMPNSSSNLIYPPLHNHLPNLPFFFQVVDFAGHYQNGRDYLEYEWFRNMKARWRTTVEDLQIETQKFDIRSSPAGERNSAESSALMSG